MKFNVKLIALVLASVIGFGLCIPSFFDTRGPKISLGLDLQGGLTILLGVNTNEAIKARYGSVASSLSYEFKDKKILVDGFKVGDDFIEFEVLDIDEKSKVDSILSKIEGLDVFSNNGEYRVNLTPLEKENIAKNSIEQAIGTIRNRLDLFGLSEPSVTRQGKDNILVQLPGIKTQEQEQRAIELISKSAHLKMMAVDEDRNIRVDSISPQEASEYGDVILNFTQNEQKILLKAIPIVDGSMIVDARVAYDNNSQPVVSFSLDSRGAELFGDFSGGNVGKRMAIVLDNKVYSAPVIRERIGGGSGQISGNFSIPEASDLAIALRSGALPASVGVLEKRSVGPSLGADSIKASLVALFSGFALILIFMVFYYSFAGLIAVLALVVNIILIIAFMSLFGATLTLPGVAGIVLTVGMSVDANIIINERIREALREGNSIRKSIEDGYLNASRAIFDSNLTTLIIAVILYMYGSGPIKGFAITMSIGIITSVLTAIVGTHGIYNSLLNLISKSGNLRFWFGISRARAE